MRWTRRQVVDRYRVDLELARGGADAFEFGELERLVAEVALGGGGLGRWPTVTALCSDRGR